MHKLDKIELLCNLIYFKPEKAQITFSNETHTHL